MNDIIFVYGPPVSGKTTVGQILAQNLNLPFIDLDMIIEEIAGKSIPEIFANEGEVGFRSIEKAALQKTISSNKAVVALGGGTLIDPECLDLAMKTGPIVCLTASFDTLTSRLTIPSSDQRPLLTSRPEVKLKDLVTRRAAHYSAFPLKINTDTKMPEQVASDAQFRLGRFHLPGEGEGCYIRIHEGGVERIGELVQSFWPSIHQVAIVTDDHVGPLYADPVKTSLESAGIDPHVIQLNSGEAHKNLDSVSFLWDEFIRIRLERSDCVLALGGGVVSDIAGFAAATFLRGIRWMVLPTTLLAMVDASIGGKTGIDLAQGKNMVGSFHTPGLVLVFPDMISSLPAIEFRNGLAEIVKHAIINDPSLFKNFSLGIDWINSNLSDVLRSAITVKVDIAREDPFEAGRRAVLNFGHTFAHALEILSEFQLRHGEAVSIGMVQETRLAEKIGLAKPGLSNKITAILKGLDLPTELPSWVNLDALVVAMQVDKKRSGGAIRFSLPVDIGDVRTGIVIDHLLERVAYN